MMEIFPGWKINYNRISVSSGVYYQMNIMLHLQKWIKNLRLRERGRIAVALRHSSPVMLSVQKCLERKCSSSGVGWKGSWCSFSCDEQDDWKWNKYIFNMKRKKKEMIFFTWIKKKKKTNKKGSPVFWQFPSGNCQIYILGNMGCSFLAKGLMRRLIQTKYMCIKYEGTARCGHLSLA